MGSCSNFTFVINTWTDGFVIGERQIDFNKVRNTIQTTVVLYKEKKLSSSWYWVLVIACNYVFSPTARDFNLYTVNKWQAAIFRFLHWQRKRILTLYVHRVHPSLELAVILSIVIICIIDKIWKCQNKHLFINKLNYVLVPIQYVYIILHFLHIIRHIFIWTTRYF